MKSISLSILISIILFALADLELKIILGLLIVILPLLAVLFIKMLEVDISIYD